MAERGESMKDLGKKTKNGIYDSTTSPESNKETIVYPEIDLPLEVIEGLGLKVDDDVDIHLKGRVSGIQDTKWTKRVSFEAKEGEVKKAGDSKKSVLDEA